MRPADRATARRQLDKRLNVLSKTNLKRPPRGWIKAIREALGMTSEQLGARIGLSQPRIHVIEKSEITGSITLGTLEKAAQALECQLVYALVPRKSLQELVMERARKTATNRLRNAGHTMALEAQGVEFEDEEEQLNQLSKRLLEKAVSEIWKDS